MSGTFNHAAMLPSRAPRAKEDTPLDTTAHFHFHLD